MKSITANMTNLLASDLTLAPCWIFVRDGFPDIAVTSHPETINDGTHTYLPRSGFTPSNVDTKIGLSVDNHDIVGFFDNAAFTESDLRTKAYDNAQVEHFFLNYENPTDGRIWISTGILGKTTVVEGRFTIEFRSLTQLLDIPLGQYYGPYCRHKLGGPDPDPITGRPGCGVDLTTFKRLSLVQTVTTQRRIFTDINRTEVNDWWAGGEILFQTGALNNVVRLIKRSFATGIIELVEPTPVDIPIGQLYIASPGCNHLFRAESDPDGGPYTGHCLTKFANGPNFGGEPEALRAALQFGGLK